MKRAYSILVCSVIAIAFGVLATVPVNAQAKTAETKAVKKHDKGPKYVCTKCWTGSDKSGTCVECKGKMTKAKAYHCDACKTWSDKAGKCAKCGAQMHKSAEHFKHCAKCNCWCPKDKDCTKCAKAHGTNGKDKTKK